LDSSALALLLALAATQAAAPPQGAAHGFNTAPPGTAGDQALWKAARDANRQISSERFRAVRLQTRARTGDYEARLEALAGKPGAPEGAKALQERLHSAWVENVGIQTRQWPVDPTRVCSYPLLYMDSAMRDDNPARRGATLPEARTRLSTCLGKARLVLSALTRSTDRFEAALAEADRLFAAAREPEGGSDSDVRHGTAAGEGAR
jgi:hypothetical protein